ncbi:unnamed protein product [Rhodiola kirilowii]
MSINLSLQNWSAAASAPPSPSAPHQIKNAAAYCVDDESWKRSLKLAKSEEVEDLSATMKMNSSHCNYSPVFSSEEQHQMLSFSSASNYCRNFTGYYGCGAATANIHEVFNSLRGPFTPSQWMELEQQALIYKHITSNMPVPSSLLIPIKRALTNAAFSHYSAPHFTSMNWGGFQMGLANSNEPEPGRCRRTDGKKWRCSRDAVADQKYCERHINRGRHRSRKPVEGHQSRYSVVNAASAHLKTTQMSSTAAVAGNHGGSSSSLISGQRKISLDKNLHLGTSASSESAHNNRLFTSKETESERVQIDSQNLSVQPSLVMQPRSSMYNIHNKQSSYEQLFTTDFGLVSSDALQNPSGQRIPYGDQNNDDNQTTPHATLTRQFIDHCPKNQADETPAWEFHSTPMGLGGPLGEVLQSSSGINIPESKNVSSGLNLMINGWDKCPRFTSSPTGVLQKEAAFASQANSSAGSSPRAETTVAATY